MSRQLLLRALAYRLQEKALGGLDRATRRRLDRAAADLAAGRPLAAPALKIKPGTRLLREWQGVVHEVIVLEGGVQYRGALVHGSWSSAGSWRIAPSGSPEREVLPIQANAAQVQDRLQNQQLAHV